MTIFLENLEKPQYVFSEILEMPEVATILGIF